MLMNRTKKCLFLHLVCCVLLFDKFLYFNSLLVNILLFDTDIGISGENNTNQNTTLSDHENNSNH